MKIGWIFPNLHFGGVENRMFHIAAHLNYPVHILNLSAPGATSRKFESLKIPVTHLSGNPKVTSAGTTLKTASWIKRLRLDLVHSFAAEGNWHGGLASFCVGTPIIMEEIGLPYDRSNKANFILSHLYKKARCVLTTSPKTRQWLIDHHYGSEETIAVVPGGVDNQKFFLRQKDPSTDKKDCFSVTAIGRLSKEKGYDVFLRSIPLIAFDKTKVKFKLFGEGQEFLALKALAKVLDIDPLIEFAGYQSPEKIPEILKDTDIYVLPSRTEGLSNSLLEAMASGCACVATSVGENSSLIKSGVSGILIPSEKPEEMAKAITDLLISPQKILQMGQRASETVQNYSWEQAATKLRENYFQIFEEWLKKTSKR